MTISKDRLERIKVLSFDGDMTLWDFNSVMRHALAHALAALQDRYPCPATKALTIDKMIDIRNITALALEGRTVNLEDIRFQAFRRTLHAIGVDNDMFAQKLNALYLKHRFEDIQLYRDVTPALSVLSRHYTLGLLSNGNSYPERCGLAGVFAFTIFAQDVGVAKPDKRIFLEACRQTACPTEVILHIGDSLETDVYGAQQVGMPAVWLNRQRILPEGDIKPDIEIHTLTELNDILGVTKYS